MNIQKVAGTRLYWEKLNWSLPDDKKIPSGMILQNDFYQFVSQEANILDVGCGFGKSLLQLRRDGYKNLVGVEINPSALSLGKTLSDGIKPPDSFLARAERLPFCDQSFDCIINQAFWTTIVSKEDRENIVREFHRVLKPDGLIYAEEYGQTPRIEENRRRYQDGIKKDYPIGTWEVTNNQGEYLYLAHHYSKDEIVELFLDNGFSEMVFYRELLCRTRSGKENDGHLIVVKS